MSDVGKLRKSGGSSFPTVRKSADPFQPEQGEMDFSHVVKGEIAHCEATTGLPFRDPRQLG